MRAISRADPVGFDSASLRRHAIEMNERVAAAPDEVFRFNVGEDYAVRCLGYDRDDLESLTV